MPPYEFAYELAVTFSEVAIVVERVPDESYRSAGFIASEQLYELVIVPVPRFAQKLIPSLPPIGRFTVFFTLRGHHDGLESALAEVQS